RCPARPGRPCRRPRRGAGDPGIGLGGRSGGEGHRGSPLLAYKERGRATLAGPLGALLAEAVAVAAGGARRPVLLVPVPSTAAAIRARHGDHVGRLAARAARCLRRAGWSTAVARPVRALPKPDATHLDSAQRAIAAAAAFRARPAALSRARRAAAGRAVVVVDDIVTTGATLAALTAILARAEVPVDAAALLAATRKRHPL
ncbi:phosphoribosyltransferase family protein, partial [Asanoa sp. NPDC050611]|uniref:phosphoribosyltransferase family protein n=1 Tax=Asanoa sp. NPDC050611 TaxID=3157098 RepID=UPI003410B45B